VWEVQLNVPAIIHVKNSLGHKAYKTTRFVQEFLLHSAATEDEAGLRELLALPGVKDMADPNLVCDRNGLSSVHYAAFHGNIRMVQMLIECGANVWAVDRSINYLPITYAISRTKWEVTEELAKAMVAHQPSGSLFKIEGETPEFAGVKVTARWIESALPIVPTLEPLMKLLQAVVKLAEAGTVPLLEDAIKEAKALGVNKDTCVEAEGRKPIIIVEHNSATLRAAMQRNDAEAMSRARTALAEMAKGKLPDIFFLPYKLQLQEYETMEVKVQQVKEGAMVLLERNFTREDLRGLVTAVAECRRHGVPEGNFVKAENRIVQIRSEVATNAKFNPLNTKNNVALGKNVSIEAQGASFARAEHAPRSKYDHRLGSQGWGHQLEHESCHSVR
jgi:hypothetical protein